MPRIHVRYPLVIPSHFAFRAKLWYTLPVVHGHVLKPDIAHDADTIRLHVTQRDCVLQHVRREIRADLDVR